MPMSFQSVRTNAARSQIDTGLHVASEDGLILLAVIFLVILVLVALAVAAPMMARSIQRDKEIELKHRGEQYKHAIKLYYKKFGAYPTSIDQLMNTNQIRFLRKRYKDPITGQDDWRIIHLGEAKVPPMGFFGQPLAGAGGPANIGTPVGSATGSSFMSTPSTSSSFGSQPGTPTGTTPEDSGSTDTGTSSTDTGISGTGFGSSTSSTSPTGTATTSPTGSSAFGNDSAIGGGPIVGVGIPSTKASLLEYKKQKHYNQWEFVYNPLEDQMAATALFGGGTQTINGANPGGIGTGSGSGTLPTMGGTEPGSTTGSGTTSGGTSNPTSPTNSDPLPQ